MIINVDTATGTQSLWKQERIILKKTDTAGVRVGVWTDLHGNYGSPLASYVVPSSGVLYIDMTDYVRTYPALTSITVYGTVSKVLTVSVVGLINPESVIIPPHWQYAKIAPPDAMFDGFVGADGVLAEFYNFADGTYAVSGAQWTNDKRGISPLQTDFDLYLTGTPTRTKKYAMRKQVCGVQYALVEWVSFSGVIRRHWFEVVKVKSSTANAYSLLPTDNEYIEIKGRQDGFTLRLDGLNGYDLWYYADMLHSSKVRVSLDGTNYAQVQVTDKSITIPDGENTDGKLEINVNWKRYDAVAM